MADFYVNIKDLLNAILNYLAKYVLLRTKVYCNLGDAFASLGDFQKAIEYHTKDLKISKEMADRAGEGRAYFNLGNDYHNLGDFQKAIEYYQRDIKIFRE